MVNEAPSPAPKQRNALMNALAALQLMIFRQPRPGITGRPRDVIVAGLILFLVTLLAHRSFFPGTVDFSVWGFQAWLSIEVIWALAAVCLALLLRREAAIGSILVVLLMAIAVATAAIAMAYQLLAAQLTPPTMMLIYYAATYPPPVVALATLTMQPRKRDGWRGMTIAVGAIVATVLAGTQLQQGYLFEMAYEQAEDDDARDWSPADPEIIYPQQAALLDQQVQDLTPQTPGQVDLYAVLGAGTPTQEVFQREITEMSSILATRFNAEGQILMLGSTTAAPTARPLMNRTNLAAGLQALAARMDVEEDIALIFLTSHGGPEQFSTRFPGLTWNDLTSTELAQALDDSGIRNAVVIIAACYSGSFVDDLEDPHRLILTAAAADRTSFGCSDSNTFSDWSAGLFDALNASDGDFRNAGVTAQTTAAAAEEAAGLRPSLPQISEGTEIGAALDRLVAELSLVN